MKIIALVIGLLFANLAFAGSATITWTAPTQNTDGTTIGATGPDALASYRIEYGTCSGSSFGTKSGEVVVNVPALTTTINALSAGTWCFRAYSKNVSGMESAPTAAVSKVVPAPTPLPPTIVTIATVAKSVSPDWGKLAFFPNKVVGSIPLGVECDASKPIGNGWYGVTSGAVKFTSSYRTTHVVAQCGS